MSKDDDVQVTRTFRLPKSIVDELEKEASERSLSVNALARQALERSVYFVWPSDKTAVLTIERKIMQSLLEHLDIKDAIKVGEESALYQRETILYIMKLEPDLNHLIAFLENNYGKWAKWFKFFHTVKGKEHTLLLTHGLDEKWSAFLEGYIGSFFKTMLDLDVAIKRTREDVVVTFRI